MVEGNTPYQAWPTYTLQQLQKSISAAKEAKKYLFIWDKQGSVGTFMQYKGQLASLGPEVIKVALNRQTNADVGEFIRKQMIHGMRQGENLCFDLDTTTPKFTDFNVASTFDAEIFFNYAEFNEESKQREYLRESEDHGIGGINPGGGYCRSPDFSMIIRSGLETEDEMNALVAGIPNFHTDFHHVIIE